MGMGDFRTRDELYREPDEYLAMSVDERQKFLDGGGIPPKLTAEQQTQLPSHQRGEEIRLDAQHAHMQRAPFSPDAYEGHDVQAMQAKVHDFVLEQSILRDALSQAQARGGLFESGENYPGYSHEEMKQHVELVNPAQLHEMSIAYHELRKALDDFVEELNTAIGNSQQEWEGDSADQAHGYFKGLTTWAEGNATNAWLSSDLLQNQSEAAETAQRNMPEPIPFNMAAEVRKLKEAPINPFLFGEIDEIRQKQQASQEAHDKAAEVMTTYDNALFTSGSRQPVFPEPPKPGGEGTAASSASASAMGPVGTTSASGFAPGTGTAGGGGVGPGAGAVPSGGGTATGGGGGGAPVATPMPGRDTGAGTTPGPGRPGSSTPPPPAGTPGSGNFGPGRGAGGMGAVPVGGMAGAGGGGAGGSPSSRAGGFGPGRGGPSPGSGFGPGGGSGSGATPGAGGRAGAMAPGAPGAAPGAASAAAAAGRGGMGAAPMGAAGGGRNGQGSEDTEHQRPTYLVEGDPDDVFGTDQRTAPPVIGA